MFSFQGATNKLIFHEGHQTDILSESFPPTQRLQSEKIDVRIYENL